jgi:hypothetical protein
MTQNAAAASETKPPSRGGVLPKVTFFLGLGIFVLIGVVFGEGVPDPDWILMGHLAEPPYRDMQVIVTLVLLPATLFIILSKRYAPKDKHWAYTTVGLILGFWLKA